MNKPSFVCAAWNVPVADFPKWIARGINTLIGCGLTVADTPLARLDWATAALKAGLWTVYDPQGLAVLENFYAALLPDELDAKEWPLNLNPRQYNGQPRELIKPLYDAFKARGFTVLMSCAGNAVTRGGRMSYYSSIADCSDIWMCDGYPRSANATRYTEALWPGSAIATLKSAAPGKPVWAMIESGWQHLKDSPNGRAPVAAETSAAFDLAIAGGVSGVGIFSHYFNDKGGWAGFDNTLPDVAAVISDRFHKLAPAPAPLPVPRTIADVDADLQKVKATLARLAAALGGE